MILLRPSIGVVGAGKVGSTLAILWHRVGYRIEAVYSRKNQHAEKLANQVDSAVATSVDEVIAACDLTMFSVADDAIESVALSVSTGELDGKAIIHNSGAHDRHILSTLEDGGAQTGSLHPAFPFASVEQSIETLPGATFAVEADAEPLHGWLVQLVQAIEGRVLVIPRGRKAVYHAALVSMSNYTVSLYAAAQRLLLELGTEQPVIDNALITLLEATVNNIRTQGIPDALTGPLTRADMGTIRTHLEAIDSDTRFADAYKAMARLTYPLLQSRGVSQTFMDELEDVFERTDFKNTLEK